MDGRNLVVGEFILVVLFGRESCHPIFLLSPVAANIRKIVENPSMERLVFPLVSELLFLSGSLLVGSYCTVALYDNLAGFDRHFQFAMFQLNALKLYSPLPRQHCCRRAI